MISGRNISQPLGCCDDTLYSRKWKRKKPEKVKDEMPKSLSLKSNILEKMKINRYSAPSPMGNRCENREQAIDFIFWGSAITDEWLHEIKSTLKKSYNSNSRYIQKAEITCWLSAAQSRLWSFSVVMYGWAP